MTEQQIVQTETVETGKRPCTGECKRLGGNPGRRFVPRMTGRYVVLHEEDCDG